MYAIEQKIVNNADYPNFCQAVSTTDASCDPDAYESFSKNFAGSIATLTQTDVDNFLATVQSTDSVYTANNIYLEKSFTQTNLVSKKARAIYLLGSPIEVNGKRFKDYTDDEAGQSEIVVDFTKDIIKDVKDNNSDLKVQVFNTVWYEDGVNKVIMENFTLIFLAFTFVLAYVSFHLKSIFLACSSMAFIGLTYPTAIFFSRFVFQVDFFQSMNFSAVFVILGIAADDVFVFTDAWQQSGQHAILNPDRENKYNNFQKRMNYTWRKAAKSITTTSLTTAMAFLATGFSDIMPISAFGFFASTLVMINFFFAITIFPALLIIFERYLAHRFMYRKYIGEMITKCLKRKEDSNEEKVKNNKIGNSSDLENQNKAENSDLSPQQTDQKEDIKEKNLSEERLIEKFFRNYWNHWMDKVKIPIIIFVAIWAGLCIWRITLFEPDPEALQMLPDSHHLTKLRASIRNDYHTGEDDNSIQVSFMWGIKGISRKGVSMWDASDRGTNIYDDDFDMSSTANQQRILDICASLRTNSLVKEQKVTCWVEDFLTAQNGGTPVAQANFYTELETYLQTTQGNSQYSNAEIGYINGRLFFMRVMALAVVEPFQGYKTIEPVYNQWEDLKDSFNEGSAAGINNAFQTGANHWSSFVTQKAFVSGAIEGTIMSLAFAFIVLVLSTLNIVTAIYAILSISCIVVSIIATMEVIGWYLGALESIAIVISIGFSVDYAVHLANHYVESVYEDRHRRMQDALASMGISIFSGAITTFGSGLFLFLATFVFFQKFAVLIVGTISFSLFFSIVFFTALNHLMGPQKNFGNLKYYIVTPCWNWIKSKSKD